LAFSIINRSQIEQEAQELTRLFPPGTTVSRDELAAWDALERPTCPSPIPR